MTSRRLFNYFFTLTIPFLFIFSLFLNNSQKTDNQLIKPHSHPKGTPHNCGFDAIRNQQLNENPQIQILIDNLEKEYQSYILAGDKTENPPDFILPVVVHIIHNGGAENISDTQIEQAIQDLNEAFENVGYYNPNTGVDTKIQFCLSKQDPDGNPSTGINRVQSSLTNMTLETQDLAVKDLSRWDPLKYINIWVVREITSLSVGPGVAGYAYFPTSHGGNEDGLMCEASFFGSTKANSGVHIHEMGHYLGLYHTFEGGCINNDCLMDGDRVCDTPPDQSTAQVPCNGSANTCSTDTDSGFATDQNDMFWNYMDYGDLNCYSAFTQGQTDRMTFTIQNIRSSLLDSKGCEDPCPTPVNVDFSASQTQVLVNTTVSFQNNSTGGNSWEWQIDNNPPFSTSQNASFTFTQTGIFWVFLTANPGDPLCEKTDSLKVKVALCGQNAHVSDLTGNDAPGCGDVGNKCKTIQYALDNIVCDTDTVFIHTGNYRLPGATNVLTPVAKMPEGLSITLFGVWDTGPVVIDGNNQRRGVQYNYLANVCPDSSPNDGIDETVEINFTNLNFENCFLESFDCNGTTVGYGGAAQFYNDLGSQLYVNFSNCQFWNNLISDPDGPNNNGRAASGAAIFYHARENANSPIGTEGSLTVDSCLFVNNRCDQFPNGGHGGAICVIQTHDVQIQGSVFCNNSVYSENADDGDLGFVRNAGGAVLFFDNTSQNPPHFYQINDSYFLGNSALTKDGANLPNSSGAGGAFLVYNTAQPFPTPNVMAITDSYFYDNINEDGQYHYGNNTGTVQTDNVQTGDVFVIDLGNDTTLCNGGELVLGDTLPFAKYQWSTGDTTPTILVTEIDNYSVTVTMGTCQGEGSIQILPCEECGNGIDDDGDGLVDCDDPDIADSCCCLTPPTLDLGADIFVCENGVEILDAGDLFAEYTWQDGFTQTSTFTAWLPGTYWVDVVDFCGNQQSDTIVIIVDPATSIDLGNDTLICEGEQLTFSLNGFDDYQWQPSISLNCDDCPTVMANPSVSTIYTVAAANSSGCITTDTIQVLVLPDDGDLDETFTICEGDSILVFGNYVSQNGTFTDTVTNSVCEYFHTITVEVLDTVLTNETRFLCQGDSLFLNGNFVSQPGFYPNFLNGFNGCDSTHLTEVVLLDTFFTTELITICEFDTAQIFGNPETESGIFTKKFLSLNGCDSMHQVILEVIDTDPFVDTLTICEGDSILVFGQFISQNGTFTDTLNNNGCEFFQTYHVQVLDTVITNETIFLCEGDSINLNGLNVSQAGIYTNIYNTFEGCDSTNLTEVILLDTFFTTDTLTICYNESAVIFGNNETQAGNYSQSFPSMNGCDSTHQITLNVLQTAPSFDTLTICFGDSILIFGNLETQAGDYSETNPAFNGCDSTSTITLEVLDALSVNFQTQPSCENETNGFAQAIISGGLPPYQYIWESTLQNTDTLSNLEPGDYGFTVIDDFGCQTESSFTIVSSSEADIEIETQDETCFGNEDGILNIIAANPNIQYSLNGQTFSPQTTFENLSPGNYTLNILDQNNCENELNFTIVQAIERVAALPPDTTICLGDSLSIISQVNALNITYEWTPQIGLSCSDCPRPTAQPLETTLYQLNIFDENGCQASDEILIQVQPKRNVYIPNVFSPNDDGLNDKFFPFAGANVALIRDFKIFDRWGELVFENQNFQPNDARFGWDGFFQGRRMNPAVFVWFVEVEFLDGEVAIFKGDVVLTR